MKENKFDVLNCFICDKLLQDEKGKTFGAMYSGTLHLNSRKDDYLCGDVCYKKYFEARCALTKQDSEAFFERRFNEAKGAAYDEAYKKAYNDIATKLGLEKMDELSKP